MFKKLLLITLLFLSFITCKKFDDYPEDPVPFEGTVFLAHHGGGNLFDPNTKEALYYGLEHMRGIECDIQISRDNSLWLGHSVNITGCDGKIKYYPLLSDNDILEIEQCVDSGFNAYMLDSLFSFTSIHFPGKYISLDVKEWTPASPAILEYKERTINLGKAIIGLTAIYHMEGTVLVESEIVELLRYIEDNSEGIETYISTYGNYIDGAEKALKNDFTGISVKYENNTQLSTDDILGIHKKGLKIQLWTINDSIKIVEALKLKPDFIQTDNLDFAETFR